MKKSWIPTITAKTRLLGVAGWPIEHSLSPIIHNAALCAAGLDYVYLAFATPPERFEMAVRGLAAAGLVGLNCTVPHKHAALGLCGEISPETRLVGAVNTLHFRDNGIVYGANTDVEGYVETLRQDAEFHLEGRVVAQFGAGGAGRAMALGAIKAEATELILINRTVEKASSLAGDLRELYPKAKITVLSPKNGAAEVKKALDRSDLVTNATSLGLLYGDPLPCPPPHLRPESLVFDAVYSAKGPTPWLTEAGEKGCRTLDGLGMLVRQGAASFRIWTGVEPDLGAMFRSLPKS